MGYYISIIQDELKCKKVACEKLQELGKGISFDIVFRGIDIE